MVREASLRELLALKEPPLPLGPSLNRLVGLREGRPLRDSCLSCRPLGASVREVLAREVSLRGPLALEEPRPPRGASRRGASW